jgi:hypothetical protein
MPRLEIPLVDSDGKPVTAGDFQIYPSYWGTPDRRVQPDERGVLVIPVHTTMGGKLEIARVYRADQLHWPETSGIPRPYYSGGVGPPPPPDPPIAVVSFPACEPGAAQHLPPVVVPDLVPRITGRVVDAAGRPVPGVRIGITSVEPPEPAAFAHFATRTDDAGLFAIRATALPAEVFVFGRRHLGFCAPVRTHPGAHLELKLEPTGTIAMALHLTGPAVDADPNHLPSVSAVVDEAGLRDGWWAVFRDRAFSARFNLIMRWHKQVWVREEGEVVLDDLVPETYEVRAAVGVTELAPVPGVRVAPGQTVRVPQLDGMSLGPAVEWTRVRVLGPEGEPLSGAFVHFTIPEWRETWPCGANGKTDQKGEASFEVPRNTVADVHVEANGMADWHQPAARFPLDVTMCRGTELEISIRGHEALKNDVRAFIVSCRSYDGQAPDTPVMDAASQQLHYPLATLELDGHCTISRLPPGRWRVWLAALPRVNARGITFVLLGDYAVTAEGPPRIEIQRQLDADALAKLRGR